MSPNKRSSKKVRYGVVGLGNIAQVAVLPAFTHARENSELVALISGDEHKRDVLADRYDVEHCGPYEQLESIIEQAELDAVYIAVPNAQHRALAERALRAGVHVLCEKPLAMTSDDCGAVLQTARQVGKKLMTAYRLHFVEGTLQTLELARSGKLGELRSFSSVFAHQVRDGDIRTRREAGGGALFDLGPYPTNMVRHLFQAEPTEVFAFQTPQGPEGVQLVDDMTTAVLRFPGERMAQFTVCQAATGVDQFTLTGTKGVLRVQDAYEYVGPQTHEVVLNEKTKVTHYGSLDQFAPELIHFSKCVLDDVEPEPSGMEGMADVFVLEALALSAQTGRPVHLPKREVPTHPSMELAMWRPPVKKAKTVNAPSPTV